MTRYIFTIYILVPLRLLCPVKCFVTLPRFLVRGTACLSLPERRPMAQTNSLLAARAQDNVAITSLWYGVNE